MTILHTRQGRTIFMEGGKTIYFAMDKAGEQIDLKRRFTFDEASDLIDSAFAGRCIEALKAKLEPSDFERVLKIFTDADLISKEEARSVAEQVDIETNGPREEMATDSRFPHANRLPPPIPASRHSSSVKAPRGMTPAETRQHDEMFPDAHRLKG